MPMLGKKPAFDALGAMTGEDTPTPELSWQDRAKIFLAALNGDYAGADRLKHEPLVQAQQRAFLTQLSGAMKGAPAQYQDGPAPSISAPGLPTAPGMEDAGGAMAAAQKALAPGPAQAAPGFQYQPPQMTAPAKPGLNINSPELASLALRGQLVGVPLTNMLDVMKAQQPDIHYDRGFGSDAKTGKPMGAFHPDLEKGQIPLYGPDGTLQGVKNIDGSVRAAAEMAGATAGAQEAAKAAYDLVDVPRPDGSMVKIPRDIAARLLGGTGAGASGLPGSAPGVPGGAAGFGVTQTPAAAELAKARAGNQGKNESDIAGARSAMQQVDDQTNMIAQNLHDMIGETQDPNTGKWVKTKPSMITGLSAGSGTSLIEHVPFLNQPANDLGAKIETVRNGTSFNSMQAIKSAMAAAGDGGSGSIRMTDQTARMLGEINGSLNQNQSGPQFEATVRRHIAQLDALANARHGLFESQYQGVRPTTPGQTGPTANYNKPSAPRTPTMAGKGYKILSVQ